MSTTYTSIHCSQSCFVEFSSLAILWNNSVWNDGDDDQLEISWAKKPMTQITQCFSPQGFLLKRLKSGTTAYIMWVMYNFNLNSANTSSNSATAKDWSYFSLSNDDQFNLLHYFASFFNPALIQVRRIWFHDCHFVSTKMLVKRNIAFCKHQKCIYRGDPISAPPQVIDLSRSPHTHTTPNFFVMELVEWQMKSIRSLLITTFPASMLLVSAFGQVWIPCEVQKMHKFLTQKKSLLSKKSTGSETVVFFKKKDPKLSKNERERLEQQTTQQKQYQGDGFSTLACMFTPIWWWHFGLETLRRSSTKYMSNLVKKSSITVECFLYLKYVNLLPSRICQLPFFFFFPTQETLEGARVVVISQEVSVPTYWSHTTLSKFQWQSKMRERCSCQ